MTKRLPKIRNQSRILIICEGAEESDYIVRLRQCKVWSNEYSVEVKNAKGIDNIPAVYQYEYANGNYRLIVILCDTEMHPFRQFLNLKAKIDGIHGNKASKHVVFFANPCSLQIVLSHFGKVNISTNSKSANATIIERLTGVVNYEAVEEQRNSIMRKITYDNYNTMKSNLGSISNDCKVVPSTNILQLFYNLEGESKKWIDIINKAIEKNA